MDLFVSRKRRRVSPSEDVQDQTPIIAQKDEDSTDFKLALLASLHSQLDHGILLEALLASNGSVETALNFLGQKSNSLSPRKKQASSGMGYQSSLTSFNIVAGSRADGARKRSLTKKGKTLHLYSPEDIAAHTPCSLILNFLPPEEADALLLELLEETPTFKRGKFQLFEKLVESPHTMGFYVNTWDEAEKQKTEYVYNGSRVTDVRRSLPEMLKVSAKVEEAVNEEVKKRIRDFYPNGKKLQYQSPEDWKPNTAFVNCYDGGGESVGYHSDHLTYLGPRAIIGSLSLGVAREFRVRKIVAKHSSSGTDESAADQARSKERPPSPDLADAQGQISIHLPHNSLLVMHAEMQEEWKHSIAPAATINPHPLAKNKRINITYRHYKAVLHPKYTPQCRCGIATVLRCVQNKKENRGRYMWMCHTNYAPGLQGCGFFQWAEFDDDGNPPWAGKVMSSNVGEEAEGEAIGRRAADLEMK